MDEKYYNGKMFRYDLTKEEALSIGKYTLDQVNIMFDMFCEKYSYDDIMETTGIPLKEILEAEEYYNRECNRDKYHNMCTD